MIPKIDLGVGEIGFTFYDKHPLLMTRTQVSNPETKSPLVTRVIQEFSAVFSNFYGLTIDIYK